MDIAFSQEVFLFGWLDDSLAVHPSYLSRTQFRKVALAFVTVYAINQNNQFVNVTHWNEWITRYGAFFDMKLLFVIDLELFLEVALASVVPNTACYREARSNYLSVIDGDQIAFVRPGAIRQLVNLAKRYRETRFALVTFVDSHSAVHAAAFREIQLALAREERVNCCLCHVTGE